MAAGTNALVVLTTTVDRRAAVSRKALRSDGDDDDDDDDDFDEKQHVLLEHLVQTGLGWKADTSETSRTADSTLVV